MDGVPKNANVERENVGGGNAPALVIRLLEVVLVGFLAAKGENTEKDACVHVYLFIYCIYISPPHTHRVPQGGSQQTEK